MISANKFIEKKEEDAKRIKDQEKQAEISRAKEHFRRRDEFSDCFMKLLISEANNQFHDKNKTSTELYLSPEVIGRKCGEIPSNIEDKLKEKTKPFGWNTVCVGSGITVKPKGDCPRGAFINSG